MRDNRMAVGFFLRFIIAFALLAAVPWPGLHDAYATAYRAVGGVLFQSFGTQGSVHFEKLNIADPADPTLDHVMVLRKDGAERMLRVTGSAWVQGFLPTALLVSLTLATPIPWRRRWRAIVWVLACACVYVAVRVLLALVIAYGQAGPVRLFTPGSIAQSVLDFLNWVLLVSFAGRFMVPIPIWFLVCFRRGDWAKLVVGQAGGEETTVPGQGHH